MEKNRTDIDDIFNKAFLHYEDQPSEEVWGILTARLDKVDADKFKKRSLDWKRVAILLLLLLSGIVLYDSRSILQGNSADNLSNNTHKLDSKISIENQPKATFKSGDHTFRLQIQATESGNDNPNVPAQKFTFLHSAVSPVTSLNSRGEIKNTNDSGKHVLTVKRQTPESKNPVEIRTGLEKNIVRSNENIRKNNDILSIVTNHVMVSGVDDNYTINRQNLKNKGYIDSVMSLPIPQAILTDRNRLQLHSGILITGENINKTVTKSGNLKTGIFKPYWAITGFASHEWGQYHLNNELSDNTSGIQNQQEEISNRENHESSLSIGLFALHQLTQHFGYKTGLLFSSASISIDPQEMYATTEPDGTIGYKYITSSGYAYINPKFGIPPSLGDSLQSANAQHKLQSLVIPLQLVYRINYRKFSIMPSAGISINVITKASVHTMVKDAFNKENVVIQSLYGMRKVYLGFMADVNFQYNYSKRWSLNVLPILRYALSPITKNNVVKTYPYSVGISAGITYHFSK